MRNFLKLVGRFGADERGVFAVIFAVMAIVIVAFGGAVVDYVSIQQAKNRAQVALDAAALALQPKIYTLSEENIRAAADDLLLERLGDITIGAHVTRATYDQVQGSLSLSAYVTTETAFVRLVGVNTMTASVLSEATRGATNIEVALALDTTGSMAGNKIAALRKATNELIDIVVKDQQTPTYSKLALVPYAATVNPGIYADATRGTIPGPQASIVNVWWKKASTTTRNITGATKASSVTITSNAHGLTSGTYIWIDGVVGMTQLNMKPYRVQATGNANTFTLQTPSGGAVSSTGYNNYTSGGTITVCEVAGCELVVDTTPSPAAPHGFATNDYLRIVGTGGTTKINDGTYQVNKRTNYSLSLAGTTPASIPVNASGPPYQTYTSGGSLYCVTLGCEYYRFQNRAGTWVTWQVSTCATERTSYAFTDASPSTALLFPNYPSGTAPCVTVPIQPLTTNKTTLHATANALPAQGATAGHLGLAWAWYMVSPNFAGILPNESKPGSYDADNLRKFVILMTDGAFNTMYCNGVLSRDATNGGNDVKNSCNAPNGSAWAQATSLCTEMKKEVTVFTVGFDIDNDTTTQNLMKACATTENHFFLASNETQLLDAFRNIAQTIDQLRVSR